MSNCDNSDFDFGALVVNQRVRKSIKSYPPKPTCRAWPGLRRFRYPLHGRIDGFNKSRGNFGGSFGVPIASLPIVFDR
jgi:hypothetical protein